MSFVVNFPICAQSAAYADFIFEMFTIKSCIPMNGQNIMILIKLMMTLLMKSWKNKY